MSCIHQRIIETKPIVEWITLIKGLKLAKTEASSFSTLTKFGPVMSTNKNRIYDCFQVCGITNIHKNDPTSTISKLNR